MTCLKREQFLRRLQNFIQHSSSLFFTSIEILLFFLPPLGRIFPKGWTTYITLRTSLKLIKRKQKCFRVSGNSFLSRNDRTLFTCLEKRPWLSFTLFSNISLGFHLVIHFFTGFIRANRTDFAHYHSELKTYRIL